MGFSSEAIFIKPGLTEQQETELLESLGFKEYVFNAEVDFSDADSRNKMGVYFGKCNGATYLIFDGAYDAGRDVKRITSKLNDHEFLSIMNYESSNSYGYHYIKNGKTIRFKEGFHPDVVKDIGEELAIEKEYYVKKEKENGTLYFYTQSDYNDELDKWTHDQIGGAVAFDLVKLITGVSYHHNDLFNSKACQYIPKKVIDRLLDDFKNNTIGATDNPELKEYFPVSYFEKVYSEIKLRLIANGFKESEDWIFKKENEGLVYKISFKPYKQGVHLIKPSFNYEIESFRADWHKKTFGRETNHFGNTITNNTQVDIHKVGIKDNFFSIFTSQDRFNFDALVALINKRFDEVIFPFFDKINSLEKIADHNVSLFKVDFLLMAENRKKAEDVLFSTIPTLAASAKKDKWKEEKIAAAIDEFQDRANLFRPGVNVKELFFSEYNKEEIENPQAKNVGEENKPIEKNIEVKNKLWWKFW